MLHLPLPLTMAETGVRFFGIVRVPLTRLEFVDGVGERLYDRNHTDHLKRLFKRTSIEDASHEHWIDGYIDNTEIPSVLRKLGLSHWELVQSNGDGVYPALDDQLVRYTQGQHRIVAASDIVAHWTVCLYSLDLPRIRENSTVKARTERYQHEKADSDGRIYHKLREYTGNNAEYHKWYERLSRNKQYVFDSISQRRDIASALDDLEGFRGMTEFLYLGSCKKFLTFRLDEEFLAGLQHIYTEWSNLTCCDRDIQGSLDKETILLLEGCNPASSPLDRRAIRAGFGTKQAFVSVADMSRRREIERRVLAAPVVIPGLRLLQQNMLYLGIAADILWSHVIPKDARTAKRNLRKTLRAALRSHWVETSPYIEIEEGVFRPALGPPSFDLAYTQLVLAALRQFPYLSFERPKTEGGPKTFMSYDPRCVALLQRRAKLLGFRSSIIDAGAVGQSSPFQPQPWTDDLEMNVFNDAASHQRAECQWGKPCTTVYRAIQTSAFLPTMDDAPEDQVGVLYGLRAMIRACFVPYRYELDLVHPVLFINESQSSQHVPEEAAPTSPQRQLCRSCLRPIEEWTHSLYDANIVQTMAPSSVSIVDMHDHSSPPGDFTMDGRMSYRAAAEEERNHDQQANPFVAAARVNQTILSNSSVYSHGQDTDMANVSASSLEHRLGDSLLSLPIHLLQLSSPDASPRSSSSSPATQRYPTFGQAPLAMPGRMSPPVSRHRPRQCDAKDRSGHGPLFTQGEGLLPPASSTRPRSSISAAGSPSSSCRVIKHYHSQQRSNKVLTVKKLPPNSKRRDGTCHDSSPSQSVDRFPLAANSVRPRPEVPSMRPLSAISRVTKRAQAHQEAARSHTTGRSSTNSLAQPTSNNHSSSSQPIHRSTFAASYERPHSEIATTCSLSPYSGVTKRHQYYHQPDTAHTSKRNSPGPSAQIPTCDPTALHRRLPQPARRSSFTASPILPRSEIPSSCPSSSRFTRRSRSRQAFNGLQEDGKISPCWSLTPPASRSPAQSLSRRWERRQSGCPRDMANFLHHLREPRRSEAYGQLSGTQGFEDSEEDFVSVNLDE